MPILDNLKICFIAGTLGQGGSERQLFYILKALRESGANSRVLCLTQGEFWESRLQELEIPVIWVGRSKLKMLRLVKVITALRQNPPAILQSQHFYTNLYVAAAARALRLPAVGTIRGDGISEVRVNGRALSQLSLQMPQRIVVNSRAALRTARMLGVPCPRLFYLPNVIDCEEFTPREQRSDACVRIVTVSRLVKQKRIDRFLILIARLQKHFHGGLRALIVGPGPQSRQLERRATELGLLPHVVTFTGAVDDMVSIYQEADIFVLTSEGEGSPNVILEAMASGLPVVATRVGGVPEIVRHGITGYVADPKDEQTMFESIRQLVNTPNLRKTMGCRAREYVELHHSLHNLPARLEKLYLEVLS